MPLSPSTWVTNNPITAHQLNQDLYTYDGSYFAANGVMFHSNRPLLIESYATASSVRAPKGGAFTGLGGPNGVGISILDTAALYGSGSDGPGDSARFLSNGAVAPGSSGVPGQPGGWNLIANFIPLGPFSGTNSAFGTAWFLSGSALQDVGAFSPGSAVYDNCGFAVDLLDRVAGQSGVLQTAVFAADPAGRNNTIKANTVSTVGETGRFTELWCGVNNGLGKRVTSIPSPITAITGSTPLSAATLNTSIQQTLNLLNYPPMLNIVSGSAYPTPINANSLTTIGWATTPLVDNYTAFNSDTVHYVVPLTGLYFVHVTTVLDTAGPAGQFATGITVNGTNYYGGWYNYGSLTTQYYGASATKVMDLQAGDTVTTFVRTTGQQIFSANPVYGCHLSMVWLDAVASGTQSWQPPEVTGFQFSAATPPGTGTGQLANIMNTRIANDLNFLLNRPYLTARQTSAQSGLGVNAWQSITMNATTGMVHGSNGDSYAGWSSGNNWYVAPVAGWYLAVSEISAATQATVTGNQLTAGFSVPTSGGVNSPTSPQGQPDSYQSLPVASAGTWPTGATAIGCYYLNAGEHIQPCGKYSSGTAATWGTDVSHGFSSHFEVIWLSN